MLVLVGALLIAVAVIAAVLVLRGRTRVFPAPRPEGSRSRSMYAAARDDRTRKVLEARETILGRPADLGIEPPAAPSAASASAPSAAPPPPPQGTPQVAPQAVPQPVPPPPPGPPEPDLEPLQPAGPAANAPWAAAAAAPAEVEAAPLEADPGWRPIPHGQTNPPAQRTVSASTSPPGTTAAWEIVRRDVAPQPGATAPPAAAATLDGQPAPAAEPRSASPMSAAVSYVVLALSFVVLVAGVLLMLGLGRPH